MVPESTDNPAAERPDAVRRILISPLNVLTSLRIRAELALSPLRLTESPLGLEIDCANTDWSAVLQVIALRLSVPERQSTRVALIRESDHAELHQQIFRAQSLDELLTHAELGWLDSILAGNRLVVYFQPLILHPPGRVLGYECLIRGIDERGGIIPPALLFDAARRLDRTRELDERCRIAALRACCIVQQPGLMFFLNFVPGALTDHRRTLGEALDILNAGGLRPEQVVFEVVETDKIQRQRDLHSLLRCYRKAGFKVALDDVGSGYSTLLSLADLRPDYIKLEGELVRRGAESQLEAKLVRDLAETARQHGIATVAEGIETPAHMRLAMDAGIRITQGYFHARPAPALLGEPTVNEVLGRVHALSDMAYPQVA